MQLDKLTAQVRPRPAWEAVDLGFMMVQNWYRRVISSWLLFTLPVFIVLNIWLYDHPFLAGLAFWWLLPIFDRIPLQILSRALFAETVSARDILRDWKSIFLPHLIKMLTFYRLDFLRSYNLPVWQLERLKGRERAQRARVLKKMQASNAAGLGFICISIELVVYLSLFGLLMLFLPDTYDHQLTTSLFKQGGVWWAGPLCNAFLYITFMIVEPFYVAGGFSLYINRRTDLEGWDIEVAFRQLAQRITPQVRRAVAILVLAMLAPCLIHVPSARADTGQDVQAAPAASVEPGSVSKPASKQAANDDSPTNNAVAGKAIKDILNHKPFRHKEKVGGWYLKKKSKAKKSSSSNSMSFLNGLAGFGNALASFGELIMWGLVAALVIGAIYLFMKWNPFVDGGGRGRKQPPRPRSLFGLDITPESLPEDVAASALALWQSGKLIEALSLLYRGALTTLVHRDGINLRGSSTEGDCMRIVSRHQDRISKTTRDFFGLLTRQWQIAAYAHRRPEDRVISELCSNWSRHFGVTE